MDGAIISKRLTWQDNAVTGRKLSAWVIMSWSTIYAPMMSSNGCRLLKALQCNAGGAGASSQHHHPGIIYFIDTRHVSWWKPILASYQNNSLKDTNLLVDELCQQ